MIVQKTNVLLLGKGGREHALAWRLAQSSGVGTIFCVPGNAGTALEGVNVDIGLGPNDLDRLVRFARKESIGLVVVGPEDPLAAGIVDFFQDHGFRVFGPTKLAAQLESSKVFAKQLMRHADVPTAEFRVFDHPEQARTYIASRDYPLVVKADGLAAGKGVFVCNSNDEALAAVDRIMVREEFGRKSGRQIVVEKRLDGYELSVLAFVAGRSIVTLPALQDHKRLLDDDGGPNTGGMGAFCPAPMATTALIQKIEETVFVPVVHAMKRKRIPFRGLLYAGLMITPQGPRVLEFNARFGDPETQCLMMRYRGDLLELLLAVTDDRLSDFAKEGLNWDPRAAVTVVLASEGYPGKTTPGKRIVGLDEADTIPDVKVFHAGTRQEGAYVLTDGGRVLNVTALGDDMGAARSSVYSAISRIHFSGMQFRKDIASRTTHSMQASMEEH